MHQITGLKPQNRLVGQVGEVGHGDSWEALGCRRQEVCESHVRDRHTVNAHDVSVRQALMSQSQRTIPVVQCVPLTPSGLFDLHFNHMILQLVSHMLQLICGGYIFSVTMIYDCALSYFQTGSVCVCVRGMWCVSVFESERHRWSLPCCLKHLLLICGASVEVTLFSSATHVGGVLGSPHVMC